MWVISFILLAVLCYGIAFYCIIKIPPSICNGTCYQGRKCKCGAKNGN